MHIPSARARVLPMDAHANCRPRSANAASKNMGGGDKGEARSCGQGEARSCGRRVEFDGTLEDLLLGCRCSECATPVPHDHVLCSACSGKGQAGKGHDYAPDAPISPWRYTTIPLQLPGFPPHNKGRVWRGGILSKSKNKGKGKGRGKRQNKPVMCPGCKCAGCGEPVRHGDIYCRNTWPCCGAEDGTASSEGDSAVAG